MKQVIKIAIAVLLFLGGFVFGVFVRFFHHFILSNQIHFFEVANFVLTASIGVAIPFLVKKRIDDNRSIKSFLVDEVKELISLVDEIKQIVSGCFLAGAISKDDKDKIIYLFHRAELKLASIERQATISFKKESPSIIADLKKSLGDYHDYLTGGDLMISTFRKVDSRFYRENNNEHSKIETNLKTSIHKIYKF